VVENLSGHVCDRAEVCEREREIKLYPPPTQPNGQRGPRTTTATTTRAGSVRAREIGKLARKHRNRYSLQQVYEIVRDIR
jgi:hypothetical protein